MWWQVGVGTKWCVYGLSWGGVVGCPLVFVSSLRHPLLPFHHTPNVAPDHAITAWVVFTLLTALHVWANVRAMRCLVLTSLNVPRLELLLSSHLSQVCFGIYARVCGGGVGWGVRACRCLDCSASGELRGSTPPCAPPTNRMRHKPTQSQPIQPNNRARSSPPSK